MSATIKRNGSKSNGTNGINLRTVLSLVAVNGIQPTTIVQLVGQTGKPNAVCTVIAQAVADGGMTVDAALAELGQAQPQTAPAVSAPKKTAAELFAEYKAGTLSESDLTAALARLTVKEPSTVKPLFAITMPGDKVQRCIRDENGNLVKNATGKGNQKTEQVFEGKARIEFRAGMPVAGWTVYVMRRHMERLVKELEARGYTEAEARKDSTCAANWEA